MTSSTLFLVIALALPSAEPPSYRPSEAELTQIREKTASLDRALMRLQAAEADPDLLLDVKVYHKAAEWIVRYADEEFYTKRYVADTLTALDHGLARAEQLAAQRGAWPMQTGLIVRAYRSKIDDSVQPYALSIPAAYDGKTPVRLDVVLHGRAMKQNEVNFIAARDTGKAAPAELDHLQLDVFGRGNNAFRWAGETDVFEAIASVQKRYRIDPQRIVLRGFSMGGAGAWHLALHHPSRWAAVEAGAGFTDTKRFLKIDNLPAHQERTLRVYDACDYALNVYDIPTVAYGGEDDAQLQASVNIREELTLAGFQFVLKGLDRHAAGLNALFLVGPKTGHKFHPTSKQQSERFIRANLPQDPAGPDHLRFVTYTTRYNECHWLELGAMERHYERAEIDARRSDGGRRLDITTGNVAELILSGAKQTRTLVLDGQTLELPAVEEPARLILGKQAGRWSLGKTGDDAARGPSALRKRHGLQGPIDDAFLESFLCVRPTGSPRHESAQRYALATLDAFAKDFARWMHGTAHIKNDTDVTAVDIKAHHLVLFGDPASNKLLGKIAARLPIRWSAEEIAVGEKKYAAADHVLAMIYPNPLNPRRYVVVNSGHTFHETEFRGNNAMVYPRLGDFAVLRLTPGGGGTEPAVEQAGLFDDRWQLPR